MTIDFCVTVTKTNPWSIITTTLKGLVGSPGVNFARPGMQPDSKVDGKKGTNAERISFSKIVCVVYSTNHL